VEQLELGNNLNSGDIFDDRFYHEVTVNGSKQQINQQLLATLSQYSRDNQSAWLTCISPEKIQRQLLQNARVPKGSVLQLISNEKNEILELAIKALKSGQSYGIVVMIKRLDAQHRETIRNAAHSEGVYCTVITSY